MQSTDKSVQGAADKILGEFCDLNPFTQAFKTLCGFAEPNDFATTS